MIKFFRQIRQKLLQENRFSKYLLYAIGEIILVVIGILIAIKINAYNTLLDEQATIKNQLENVTLEIRGNITLLDNTLEKSEGILSSCRTLTKAIALQDPITSKQLSALLGSTFAPVLNYEPNTVILNEMIQSGSIRNLKDKNLKQMLLAFQAKQAKLKNQEFLHAEDQKACTDDMLQFGDFKAVMDETGVTEEFFELPISKRSMGNQALIDSKTFENKLLLFMASGIGLERGEYLPLKAYMETLLVAIEKELQTYD